MLKVAALFDNPRFYILAFSVAISIFIPSWLRLHIPSDQLFYIRTEQIFGYACILYWYVALLVSPLHKRLEGRFGTAYLVFARRSIGVSAAYFALLHVVTSMWAQIGGLHGLSLLPERFLWALGFGGIGVVILIMMAATSFNKVIAFMTFRRWKWLHRLGYIGGVLVLLHMWMIGTHLSYLSFRSIIFVLLVVLFRFESIRIAENLAKKYPQVASKSMLIAGLLWLAIVALLISLPLLIEPSANHHSASLGQLA